METSTGIGAGHLFAGRYAEAISVLRVTLEEFPHFVQTYRYLASAYANLGQLDEAREVVRRLRLITPLVVPPRLNNRNQEQLERFLSGLRLAAGEAP